MSGAVEDGGDLVALAMNVGTQRHPAWWLNLEAHPDAVVQLAGQRPRRMHARIAREERERLWRRWAGIDLGLDALAGRRSIETPSWSSSPSCTTARR
ncbi:MAG: nitroreductase/quinone reductase family protein, partial [Acidimicrobiia bacterium]